MEVPETRVPATARLRVVKAENLQDITVDFPLGKMVCVTGVSVPANPRWSIVLYKTLAAAPNGAQKPPRPVRSRRGMEWVDKVIGIDQSPIGRTPRNPATYTSVFGDIRSLFNTQDQDARLWPRTFQRQGGRCEAFCEGSGICR